MKKFILFVSTALCAACTNTVSQNIQLSKDEGIAVFKLDCPERYVAGVDILPSGMKPTGSTG